MEKQEVGWSLEIITDLKRGRERRRMTTAPTPSKNLNRSPEGCKETSRLGSFSLFYFVAFRNSGESRYGWE